MAATEASAVGLKSTEVHSTLMLQRMRGLEGIPSEAAFEPLLEQSAKGLLWMPNSSVLADTGATLGSCDGLYAPGRFSSLLHG